jgi:hypothetical protein
VALVAARAGSARGIMSPEVEVGPTEEDELGPSRPVHGRRPAGNAVTLKVGPFLSLG